MNVNFIQLLPHITLIALTNVAEWVVDNAMISLAEDKLSEKVQQAELLYLGNIMNNYVDV